MPSKNNLAALKARPAILPAVESQAAQAEVMQPAMPRRGPQPKPANERRSHKIQLSLTPAEAASLKDKAGLVNEATYVHAKLKELGIFD